MYRHLENIYFSCNYRGNCRCPGRFLEAAVAVVVVAVAVVVVVAVAVSLLRPKKAPRPLDKSYRSDHLWRPDAIV